MDINSKQTINFLLKPGLIFLMILVMFALSIAISTKEISKIQTRIKESETMKANLTKKVVTLETVEKVLPGDVGFIDIALPSKISTLYALSQIKETSATNSLLLNDIKTSNPVSDKAGIFKSTISFEVEGGKNDIFNFLNSFSTLLPIMKVDKVDINNSSSDFTSASVSLNVYSAELPKKLPTISSATTELTPAEIEILGKLAEYLLPGFIEPSAENIDNLSDRSDPFN